MALVLRSAKDRTRSEANAGDTRIGLRTSVVVVAIRPIGDGRIGASARCRIARTSDMALVERRANDGIRARASARLACIRLRTGIAICARRSVIGVGIVASSGHRIANADDMALIEGIAGNRIGSRAYADLTCIGLRTRIVVIARCPVIGVGIAAQSCRRVACTSHVALIQRRAGDRICARAGSCLACVRLRTCIAIGARRSIIRIGIAAGSGRGIADSNEMALIQC